MIKVENLSFSYTKQPFISLFLDRKSSLRKHIALYASGISFIGFMDFRLTETIFAEGIGGKP